MTAADPSVVARLERERERTVHRLATLRGDFDAIVAASDGSNADDEHDPEGHTIAYERSQVDALIRLAERHLEEIDEGLRRVGEGSFGVCERCGEAISPERLAVRPTARHCVGCASARRRQG
ncbi:TraR/DksA family transcriptional regulator [Nocardioides ferulae]|uniref:TraR/DksA family transcriptional regulator n=1 Tax=Nocardioides ferulae TaxID=2340821 RepID=UPI000EAF985E|nr:TraR/DksA C4-type zinc finger protein [Nocardioides ferulae]